DKRTTASPCRTSPFRQSTSTSTVPPTPASPPRPPPCFLRWALPDNSGSARSPSQTSSSIRSTLTSSFSSSTTRSQMNF
ncbi:hypothetical protein BST12_29935, partial [Mycobacterium angelicum]